MRGDCYGSYSENLALRGDESPPVTMASGFNPRMCPLDHDLTLHT